MTAERERADDRADDVQAAAALGPAGLDPAGPQPRVDDVVEDVELVAESVERRRIRRPTAPASSAAAVVGVASASVVSVGVGRCRWSSWVLEADPAHLGHESHPGRRLHTVAHQRQQLVDIRRGGARFGLDEVGVLLRDHRAADARARADRPPRR